MYGETNEGCWGVLDRSEGGRGVYSMGEMCSISCMVVVVNMTLDPRIPTALGRSMSGSHRPDRRCYLHQKREVKREVYSSASRMKGELHPTQKNRL